MVPVADPKHHIFKVRAIIFPQDRRKLLRLAPPSLYAPAKALILQDGRDPFMVAMTPVKGHLIIDPQADEDGHGHADRKTADVDGGGEPVPHQAAERDPEIIS